MAPIPLLNTDAFYISTEKDPPSPLAGSFSCRPPRILYITGYTIGGSWFVKACHYTRMGCGQTSQRDAQRASRSRICVVSQTGPQGHRTHIRQRQPSAVSISSRILYITGYMIGGSWFVKTCHYTRMRCDEISLTGCRKEPLHHFVVPLPLTWEALADTHKTAGRDFFRTAFFSYRLYEITNDT